MSGKPKISFEKAEEALIRFKNYHGDGGLLSPEEKSLDEALELAIESLRAWDKILHGLYDKEFEVIADSAGAKGDRFYLGKLGGVREASDLVERHFLNLRGVRV